MGSCLLVSTTITICFLFCIMLSQRQNQIENRNVDKRVEEYFNRLQSTNNTIIVTSVIYCLTVFPSFFLSLCFWTPKYLRIMLKFHFLGACLLLTYLLILKFLGKY